jgi:taurine dioxygenase
MSGAEQTTIQQRPRPEESIVVTPCDAPLGAEIRCGDLAKVSEAGRQQIRQAFLDHLVLVFPGQHLSEEEQVEITNIFGTPEFSKGGPLAQMRVVTISNQPGGALGSGELRWHSDHSFEKRPFSASLLHALEIPPEGGDTLFSNMYLAYATLAPALRERVRGLTIKNDISTNSAGERVLRVPETTDVRLSLGPSHPIIRTHAETGLNALYLGRRPFAYVNGLEVPESEALLDELWAHAANLAFEYRHHWKVGDLVVWDNRAAMHRRDAMHRTQCQGDEPVHYPAADARGFHARAADWISRSQA